jgi:hypothetical protein
MYLNLEKCGASLPRVNVMRWVLLAIVFTYSISVSAAPVTYQLGNHPNTALAGPYGLRYDTALPLGVGPTFSVGANLGGLGGATSLSWDDSNLTAGADISGVLYRNDDGTSWNVNFNLSGLVLGTTCGVPPCGFVATGGSGSLDEIGGAGRSILLTGKQDVHGWAFYFNNVGYRLGPNGAQSGDGWVGRGWLEGASGSTDDWLVTAQVPVPTAVWLFGSALLGLFGIKRSKQLEH